MPSSLAPIAKQNRHPFPPASNGVHSIPIPATASTRPLCSLCSSPSFAPLHAPLRNTLHSTHTPALVCRAPPPLLTRSARSSLPTRPRIGRKHPNIVKCYGWFRDAKRIYIVIELARKGELFKILRAEPEGKFAEPKAARYVAQLASALHLLKKYRIVHRDIKPENLLLGDKDMVKLADFGWAVKLEPGSSNKEDPSLGPSQCRSTYCGTMDYLSPEMTRLHGGDGSYDESIDTYAMGVLMYELITGVLPSKVAKWAGEEGAAGGGGDAAGGETPLYSASTAGAGLGLGSGASNESKMDEPFAIASTAGTSLGLEGGAS